MPIPMTLAADFAQRSGFWFLAWFFFNDGGIGIGFALLGGAGGGKPAVSRSNFAAVSELRQGFE